MKRLSEKNIDALLKSAGVEICTATSTQMISLEDLRDVVRKAYAAGKNSDVMHTRSADSKEGGK